MDSFVKASNDLATEDLVILSPLDQIMPRVHVPLVLYLPTQVSSEKDHATIFSALEKGLQRTLVEIPYLGGVVGQDKDNSGKVHIAPGPGVLLRLKILGDDTEKSYQNLKDSHFPSLEGIKAPVEIMPPGSNLPVMAAQVNIIQGGVLLATSFHHSVVDAAGFATVLKTWASNTNKIPHSDGASGDGAAKPNSLPSNSLDKSSLMKALMATEIDPLVRIKKHPQYKLETTPLRSKETKDAPIAPPTFTLPAMTPTVFHFAAPKLAALKFSASPSSGSFISTNDALCALLWSSITQARTLSENATEDQETPSSILGMAVDGRRRLSPALPASYVGNVTIYASARLPISILSQNTELKGIASAIRTAITELDNDHIQDVIALVTSLSNVTELKPDLKRMLGRDLAITSWREMGLIGLDWGARIGKVEAVRLPKGGFDGLCIILPELAEGGLEVLVGLENGAMERLKEDETFMAFAEMRCT